MLEPYGRQAHQCDNDPQLCEFVFLKTSNGVLMMAVVIQGDVAKNTLDVSPSSLEQLSGLIRFMGTGSTVSVGEGCSGYAISIVVEDSCDIIIGTNCALGALEIFSVRGSKIQIGAHCGFTSKAQLQAHEKSGISIGDGCLIASSVWLTSSDMHPIFDLATGERINESAEITIGNNVWIANNVTVLKGVSIGAGSIVGTGAVVTRSIGENSLALGNPAETKKTNVSWRLEI